MKSTVIYKSIPEYEYAAVDAALRTIVNELGGMARFVRPGQRVLLKPNLLRGARPDEAITTHPLVVKSIAQQVLEVDAKPFIGDSYSSYRRFKNVCRDSGMLAVAHELNIPLEELCLPQRVPAFEGQIFPYLELSRKALEADVVINLAKCKTHVQMLLTLGIKNLFGTIPRRKKVEWHLMTGVDRTMFGLMLMEIYQALKPAFTILDGILALERNGPDRGGEPVNLRFLSGSDDIVALEAFTADYLGVEPDALWTIKAAQFKNIGNSRLSEIITHGDELPQSKPQFRLPDKLVPLDNTEIVRHHLKDFFLRKPVVVQSHCSGCGECIEQCPTQVITNENGAHQKLSIEYINCIRCGLCVEKCPEKAIFMRKGLLQWLF